MLKKFYDISSNFQTVDPFPVFLLLLRSLATHGQLAQPGLDPNVLLQNYRNVELTYAREFIRPTGIATPFDSQITFVQQVIAQRYAG